ncbi:MAG: hypothetical protein LBS01_05590 [Prevotellaceae bacterium]|nr:hypothetical protein [Prevotellaceae bacterium]
MNKPFGKILSIILALLYFGTTTGFGVVRCNHLGQLKVIFPDEKTDICICKAQKPSPQMDDCHSHEDAVNNSLSDNYKTVQDSSEDEACCALSFLKLDVQTTHPEKANHYNSTDYKILFYPCAITANVDFIPLENNIVFSQKPSPTALIGHTALIYQYRKLRN